MEYSWFDIVVIVVWLFLFSCCYWEVMLLLLFLYVFLLSFIWYIWFLFAKGSVPFRPTGLLHISYILLLSFGVVDDDLYVVRMWMTFKLLKYAHNLFVCMSWCYTCERSCRSVQRLFVKTLRSDKRSLRSETRS